MAKKRSNTKSAFNKKTSAASSPDERYTIHVIAASTGDLLYRLATVAATQFSGIDFQVEPHPLADTHTKLERILHKISGPHEIVIHGLADVTAKQLVRSYCVQQQLPHFDATGPLFDFLADCVGRLPDNDLSTLHRVDAAYHRRIEAMEFAMEHDDGLGINTLHQADIIIVGPSRVSKSPTTLFLASRGYNVANVSIAPETGFPPRLSRVSKKKIVAFTMQPKRLQEIRFERMREAGTSGTDYDNLNSVIREILDFEAECGKRNYPLIDVTNLTIEQTAVRTLEHLRLTS